MLLYAWLSLSSVAAASVATPFGFFLFFFPFFGFEENPPVKLANFVVVAFGAFKYICMSLSAVSESFATTPKPRFSPPHFAFTARSRKISVSEFRAAMISSMRDPLLIAYAPFPRTTVLSATSLVATYTSRFAFAAANVDPGVFSSPSSADPAASLSSIELSATRPYDVRRASFRTFSTLDRPLSSSMDARSIHESASLLTE